MPISKAVTAADRAQATNTNTYPRLLEDGTTEVILLPEDLLEQKGNLADINHDGMPDGFRLVSPEKPEYRKFYVGTRPDQTYLQHTSSVTDPSYLMAHPLVEDDRPPGTGDITAQIATPGPPTIKLEPASVIGFPEATPESPLWFAFGYKLANGQHSDPGPAVSATGGQGQSYRLIIPEDIPQGVDGLDIWVSEPGTSSATTQGRMRIQETLDLSTFTGSTHDLLGPYKYNPDAGGDTLVRLKAPLFTYEKVGEQSDLDTPIDITTFAAVRYVLKAGMESQNEERTTILSRFSWWKFGITSPFSPSSEGVTYNSHDLHHFRITRPPMPPEAIGWQAFVWASSVGYPQGYWARWFRNADDAGTTYNPIPVTQSYVEFGDDVLGVSLVMPQEPQSNFSGDPKHAIPPPDDKPEPPVPFGASRLAPGKYYAKNTLEAGGLETFPSLATEFEIGEADIPRIIPDNEKNRLANATLIEKGADGLPLSFTIVTTGGTATTEAGEIVLKTSAATAGTTPSALSDPVEVDATTEGSVAFHLKMEYPSTGAIAGSVEAVWRQTNASGANTDTVMATLASSGEKKVFAKILETGGVGTYVRSADTVSESLLFRYTGGSKNATLRASRMVLNGYAYAFRRGEVNTSGVDEANPPPETAMGPGADVLIGPPPSPAMPPEGETIPDPDRPRATGVVLDSSGYESGLPSGWTSVTAGGATVTTDAASALAGSSGLHLQKSSGGTLGYAYQHKDFTAETGLSQRHSLANLMKYKIASLSAGHYIDLHGLARPSDGSRVAFLRYANAIEQARLTISERPSRPGNVRTNLDGTNTDVAVVATQEQATLSLTAEPTAPGEVRVDLGNLDNTSRTTYRIPVGGTQEEFTLRIDRQASTLGVMNITVDGVEKSVFVSRYWTREFLAQQIANLSWSGWTVTLSGRTVKFKAISPGPKTDPTFDTGTSGILGTITMITQGSVEARATLAQRIREVVGVDGTGWTTTGTANDIVFTAIEAGARLDATYTPGSTGAAGTVTTGTQGARDTTDDLAERIRAAIDALADWVATRVGSVITITAAAAGVKQNGYYDAQGTGATGTFETLIEGSSGDVFAIARDKDGVEQKRKILPNVGTGIWNADLQVGGADAQYADESPTEYGIVNVWGSTGSNAETLLARFEGIDLTGYPAGRAQVGVIADSSASATWDVYADEMKITDKGETHFEELDYFGRVLNQAYWHGPPSQPPRSDVFFQGFTKACIPGTQERWAAKVRWDGIPEDTPAYPLFLVAVRTSGEEYEIGDVTEGLAETGVWQDLSLPAFTIPDTGLPEDNYYELRLSSRDVGVGEIVIQQVAGSLGATVKRTPFYATSGTHRVTLDISTPYMPNFLSFGRERTLLEQLIDIPTGTTATDQSRASDSLSGPWDSWQADISLAAQKNFVQVETAMTGDGTKTPVLKAEYPKAEYRLLSGRKDLATFLKGDRTEVIGGAIFEQLREHSDVTEVLIHPIPGGDFDRTTLYSAVPKFPEFTLQVFTPDAMRYIERYWGEEYFCIEDEEKAYTIKLRGLSRFEKTVPRRGSPSGQQYALYKAKVPEAVVVSEVDLA